MKNLIKNLIYRLFSHFNFGGIVILMYHSVAENDEFFTVRPKEFEKQMTFLKNNGFNVVRLEDLPTLMQKPILSKTLIITFDDGYEDNYLNAYPILEKYNLPATIFVSTGRINKSVLTKRGMELKGLTIDQIKEMSRRGLVDFGAHTHNHPKLIELSDEEARNEILNSKNILEEIMGRDIKTFAYPFGIFNENIRNFVGECFQIACAIRKGRVSKNDDLLILKRNSIDSEVSFVRFKGIIKFGRLSLDFKRYENSYPNHYSR